MRKRILTALTAGFIIFSGGFYLTSTPVQASQGSSCLSRAIDVYNTFVAACSGTADCTFTCDGSGGLASASCTCE